MAMSRLPVYKKIQGKGWVEVREEPLDSQTQLRYQAIMNEWMKRQYPYRYLEAEAEKLKQQQRDNNMAYMHVNHCKQHLSIPDPDVPTGKEERSDGDQIIKEIIKEIMNISIN